jgi:hypothetical protein
MTTGDCLGSFHVKMVNLPIEHHADYRYMFTSHAVFIFDKYEDNQSCCMPISFDLDSEIMNEFF